MVFINKLSRWNRRQLAGCEGESIFGELNVLLNVVCFAVQTKQLNENCLPNWHFGRIVFRYFARLDGLDLRIK